MVKRDSPCAWWSKYGNLMSKKGVIPESQGEYLVTVNTRQNTISGNRTPKAVETVINLDIYLVLRVLQRSNDLCDLLATCEAVASAAQIGGRSATALRCTGS